MPWLQTNNYAVRPMGKRQFVQRVLQFSVTRLSWIDQNWSLGRKLKLDKPQQTPVNAPLQ